MAGISFVSLVGTGVIVTGLSLGGCSSDLPSGVNHSTVPADQRLSAAAQSASKDALLSKIGRGLALALADPATRAWVRSQIDASPYVEWRIPFRGLLNEARLPQVQQTLRLARLTAAEAEQRKTLPDLELYFPIASQRTSWKPNEPVQVAVRLGHQEKYVIYGMKGTASPSNGRETPAMATLVLAASEIDFNDPESALRGGVRTGSGMQALVQAGPTSRGVGPNTICDPDRGPCGGGGGGGGGGGSPPVGGDTRFYTHYVYLMLRRDHEGIYAGLNEIEILGEINGAYRSCGWYTGMHYGTAYAVNFGEHAPNSTLALAIPIAPYRFKLKAYEDDDTRCAAMPNDDPLGNFTTGLSYSQYGFAYFTESPGDLQIIVSGQVP